MAWDFSTEPEFAVHVDWMRDLVREEIQPLEVLELEWEQLSRAMEPLQERVKERGLWAAHLDPELMRWLGVSRRAFDMLCERALSREVGGAPLAEKETVQNWIADSAAEMQAARLMTLHAAWTMDTQGVAAARREISLIKFYGAKVLHDIVDRALQVHGSLGYSTDMPLEAMYRVARGARFYHGPDEVHRESVARRILRGYEPAPGGVPTEHIPTRREAARERFAWLLEAVTSND